MATATEMHTRAIGPQPYRFSVEQYHAMIDARIFPHGARVELLGGNLVEKVTKYPPHNFGVTRLSELLRAMLPAGFHIREERSINLDGWSQPGPDVVVARGDSAVYRARHPRPADIALIVEVPDSTCDYDRGEKWRRYAAAGIPSYAILNIARRRLEAFNSPKGRDDRALYRETAVIGEDAAWTVRMDDREVGRLAVRELLA